ncbi:MAG TPA: alpha/beta hydrolase [Gemmataceae bacterium]|nr:alpha/beta hydrolase [Gemmataceae bacterium]
MAFVENRGAKIYWDEQGQGEPILLIMGLGYPSDMWHRTRPVLNRTYKTIAFDNRGAGRSDVPPGPYSIDLMASDALAVLNAAGIQAAHVIGVSMGGMIAQELTLRYPERVRSVILGCTACGGPNLVQAEPEVLQVLMARANMTGDQMAEAAVPFIYDASTPRARIDEDIAIRRPWFPTSEGYLAQLQGIIMWESFTRLPQINIPTLILHGETDRLVPAGNAAVLAKRIANSTVAMLPQASHIFSTDQPEAAHKAMLDFLATQQGSPNATPETVSQRQ